MSKRKTKYVIEELPNPGIERTPITWGYARVSTADQNTELQTEELTRAGCAKVIKDDGYTGANTDRPGLTTLLKSVREGDTVVVWKLDRLGRSLSDLVKILESFGKTGIKFRSLH